MPERQKLFDIIRLLSNQLSVEDHDLLRMLLHGEDVPKEQAERVRTLVQDILEEANQADMDSHNSPP